MKITFLVKTVVAVVVLYLLCKYSQVELSLFLKIIESPLSMICVIGLCYVMIGLHAWRWFRLNSAHGIKLNFSRTLLPTYMGNAFNNILPGSVGGDFVRLYFILKRFPTKKSSATFSLLLDRASGLIGIFTIVCVSAPYYMDVYQHNDSLYSLLLVCVCACVLAVCVWLSLLLLNRDYFRKVSLDARKTRFTTFVNAILEAVYACRNNKLVLVESVLISIISQLALLLIMIIIVNMMGLPHLSTMDYMLALVVGQIASLIPLTPGGIGVGEAAFANVLMLLNPGSIAAYATAFLALRLLSSLAYVPGLFLGVYGFDLLRKSTLATDT